MNIMNQINKETYAEAIPYQPKSIIENLKDKLARKETELNDLRDAIELLDKNEDFSKLLNLLGRTGL